MSKYEFQDEDELKSQEPNFSFIDSSQGELPISQINSGTQSQQYKTQPFDPSSKIWRDTDSIDLNSQSDKISLSGDFEDRLSQLNFEEGLEEDFLEIKKELPEHSCLYCGMSDVASSVKCQGCNKWFCNSRYFILFLRF